MNQNFKEILKDKLTKWEKVRNNSNEVNARLLKREIDSILEDASQTI